MRLHSSSRNLNVYCCRLFCFTWSVISAAKFPSILCHPPVLTVDCLTMSDPIPAPLNTAYILNCTAMRRLFHAVQWNVFRVCLICLSAHLWGGAADLLAVFSSTTRTGQGSRRRSAGTSTGPTPSRRRTATRSSSVMPMSSAILCAGVLG